MSPALIGQIANYISLAIGLAPKVEEAVKAAIAFINGLFGSGEITKSQQDELMAHVDAVLLAFVHDTPPPAWTVEPDPVTGGPATKPADVNDRDVMTVLDKVATGWYVCDATHSNCFTITDVAAVPKTPSTDPPGEYWTLANGAARVWLSAALLKNLA